MKQEAMGVAVRVRSAGQKYGPTCHQRDRADVTEFVTLVRLSSLGQHVGVLALAGYKRRKSALTAGPIPRCSCRTIHVLHVFLLLPATSAEVERGHSALKLIKTKPRSTMGEEPLECTDSALLS